MILLNLIQLCSSFSLENRLLTYSDQTPSDLLALFSDYTKQLYLAHNFSISNFETVESVIIIVDISLDTSLFWALDSLCDLLQVKYFTLSRTLSSDSSKFRYLVHPPLEFEAEALYSLVNFLQWSSFSIFSSNYWESSQIVEILLAKFPTLEVDSFVYEKNAESEQIDTIVKKFIKVTGIKNLLVIDQGPTLKIFVETLIKRNIPQYGSYFLFGSQSVYNVNIEGALLLTEPQTELSISLNQYHYYSIISVLSHFKVFSNKEFDLNCPQHSCVQQFSLINIKNQKTQVVGSASSEIKLTQTLIFPLNNTSFNANRLRTQLVLSMANGTSEPYNAFTNVLSSISYMGTIYAVAQSNTLNEIKNFEFILHPTDCGNLYYDAQWFLNCLGKQSSSLGLAYLTGDYFPGALGNLLTLRELGVFIPQVSPTQSSDSLDNSTEFPEILTLVPRFDDYLYNSILLCMSFGWRDFVVFSTEDPYHDYMFEIFLNVMTQIGANYVNPESLRVFPANYTYLNFEVYRQYFQIIKDSRCRLIQLMTKNPGDIIEGMYDIGIRKGDVIIIGSWTIFEVLYENISDSRMAKRKELLESALLVSLNEYIGPLGKSLKSQLSKLFSTTISMCMAYDSFFLVQNAIKHLMSIGESFDDPNLLMSAIRTQRFVGCSGDVYFLQGRNSRGISTTEMDQVVYNETLGRLVMRELVYVDKYSIITTEFVNEPVWVGGLSEVPSNYIVPDDCGFDSKNRSSSVVGRTQILVASVLYLTVTCISAIVSTKTFDYPIEPLNENIIATYNDHLYMLFIIFEFFQILTLEPSNGVFSKTLRSLQYFIGMDPLTYFNLTQINYWKFYFILLITSAAFIVLSCLAVVLRKLLLRNLYFLAFLNICSESILPILGHIGFFPKILLLFTIFDCNQGTGASLQDSFLQQDCTTHCYTGKHTDYVIAASLLLVLLLVVSVLCRPYWELSQLHLNLRTRPVYLAILSVFQVLFICIHINIKAINEAVAGFTVSGAVAILIFITIKLKPFNYERAAVYHVASLAMAAWALLISSFEVFFGYEYVFAVILFGGVFVIGFAGMVFSFRFPKRFVSDEPGRVPTLIKFQFSKISDNSVTRSKYLRRISGIVAPEGGSRDVINE